MINFKEGSKEIGKALLEIQKEIKPMRCDASGYGYKYLSLDAILALVKPILSKHGIVVMQDVYGDIVDGLVVGKVQTTLLQAETMEWVKTDPLVIKVAKPKKGTFDDIGPQELGSATTYAKRYQLAGLLGIASDPDDDGKAASYSFQETKYNFEKITEETRASVLAKSKALKLDKDKIAEITTAEFGQAISSKMLTETQGKRLIEILDSMQK